MKDQITSAAPPPATPVQGMWGYAKFLLLGIYFGFVLIKGLTVSWCRMQEMFRFESFYYFGMFMTAVPTAWLGVKLIRRFGIKSMTGEPVRLVGAKFQRANIYGGLIFGVGWGMAGVCPGPIYASIGAGISVMVVSLASALVGTYLYGVLKPRLPH